MLSDRFKQVTGTAQSLEPGGIPPLSHGRQNNNARLLSSRIVKHCAGNLLSIHAWQLHIQQNNLIWVACTVGTAKHLQSFGADGGSFDPAIKTLDHVGQNQPVGCIIVHG